MANRYAMNDEYFTGSQTSIFIGDIWVDDIIDMQCSVGANSTPIYGYGSTFYDHAAQGRVLVQGSFTINFKEPNYLFAVLARYYKFNGDFTANYNDDVIESNVYKDDRAYIEKSFRDKRQTLDEFFYSPTPRLDRIASAKNKQQATGRYAPTLNNGETGSLGDKYKDYTGVVSKKVLEESRLDSKGNILDNDFAVDTFDIKIGYGTVIDENTIGEKIVGVKLVGKGKVIMANGEPIKESYSFFARNVI